LSDANSEKEKKAPDSPPLPPETGNDLEGQLIECFDFALDGAMPERKLSTRETFVGLLTRLRIIDGAVGREAPSLQSLPHDKIIQKLHVIYMLLRAMPAVDINILDENMDKVDAAIGDLRGRVSKLGG